MRFGMMAAAAACLVAAPAGAATVTSGTLPAAPGAESNFATFDLPDMQGGQQVHFRLTFTPGTFAATSLVALGEGKYTDIVDFGNGYVDFLGNEYAYDGECMAGGMGANRGSFDVRCDGGRAGITQLSVADGVIAGRVRTDRDFNDCPRVAALPERRCATFFSIGRAYLDLDVDADVATSYRLVISDVTAVPEPATWAMMIAGFAACAATMRRRRPRVTPVAHAS